MVTFQCAATGNPTPKMTWTKDGKTVAEGDTLSFRTNRTQSGKYWCSAENGVKPSVNASADLDVQCKYFTIIPDMNYKSCHKTFFLRFINDTHVNERKFCPLLILFLTRSGLVIILRMSQNIRTYYMLNYRIRCKYRIASIHVTSNKSDHI